MLFFECRKCLLIHVGANHSWQHLLNSLLITRVIGHLQVSHTSSLLLIPLFLCQQRISFSPPFTVSYLFLSLPLFFSVSRGSLSPRATPDRVNRPTAQTGMTRGTGMENGNECGCAHGGSRVLDQMEMGRCGGSVSLGWGFGR